jgi:hypothetical protein
MRLTAALLLLATIAHADSSPPKDKSIGTDWCWVWFRAKRDAAHNTVSGVTRVAPVSSITGWKRYEVGPKLFLRAPGELAEPATLPDHRKRIDSLSHMTVENPLRELQSGFRPILAIVDRKFEALVKDAEDSGDLFPGTVTSATRPITVGKQAATELCAMVARSPGHATLQDGRHIPMPMTYDLIRGYRIERKAQPPVTIAFRVEESDFDTDEPIFSRILESLEIE